MCNHKWLCEKMISRRDGDLQYCTTKYVCDKCGKIDVRMEIRNTQNNTCRKFVVWD